MLRGEVNNFASFHARRIEYKEMEPLSLAKKNFTQEKWGCVDDDKGQPMCPGTVVGGKAMPKFDDLSNFSPCQH